MHEHQLARSRLALTVPWWPAGTPDRGGLAHLHPARAARAYQGFRRALGRCAAVQACPSSSAASYCASSVIQESQAAAEFYNLSSAQGVDKIRNKQEKVRNDIAPMNTDVVANDTVFDRFRGSGGFLAQHRHRPMKDFLAVGVTIWDDYKNFDG